MTVFCHLIDDTSPGGVMRMLEFIQNSKTMAALGSHDVQVTPAGLSRLPKIKADIIVSHIVLSWKNLPFFVALRARYPKKTIVQVEHHYSAAFEADEVSSTSRFRAMLRVSVSLFDQVVSISCAQQDWLREEVGISDETITLIPSCVSLGEFLSITAPSGPIQRIGAIGRLHPQKGFDVLIAAFREAALPGVVLDIFGDGPDLVKLKSLAAADPAIVFHGHITDPAAALAAVDAVAMPSRREPYGLVAIEAMAAGRPLLVSKADGLLDHAATGAIAVDMLTAGAWAAALKDLVAAPDFARASMARQRVARMEENFAANWERMVAEM